MNRITYLLVRLEPDGPLLRRRASVAQIDISGDVFRPVLAAHRGLRLRVEVPAPAPRAAVEAAARAACDQWVRDRELAHAVLGPLAGETVPFRHLRTIN